MDQRLQPLFTPWKIGNCEIKNRIVLTSMGGTDLFGWMEKNHFDKDGARFIMEVAKNNAGLVLPGCQPVYNPMFGQWLHKNKKMYADLKKWTPELHKTGAKLFVQLTAGFGRSFTISEMMEKLYTNPALRVLSKPFMDLDKITASASPSPNRWSDKVPSREMTKAEIKEFVNAFAESAKMLKDAGVTALRFTQSTRAICSTSSPLNMSTSAPTNTAARSRTATASRSRSFKLSRRRAATTSRSPCATA